MTEPRISVVQRKRVKPDGKVSWHSLFAIPARGRIRLYDGKMNCEADLTPSLFATLLERQLLRPNPCKAPA